MESDFDRMLKEIEEAKNVKKNNGNGLPAKHCFRGIV